MHWGKIGEVSLGIGNYREYRDPISPDFPKINSNQGKIGSDWSVESQFLESQLFGNFQPSARFPIFCGVSQEQGDPGSVDSHKVEAFDHPIRQLNFSLPGLPGEPNFLIKK